MASAPETQYALSAGNHIAYQVVAGPKREPDILLAPRTTNTATIDILHWRPGPGMTTIWR